jgi:membrane peptidoglycan carboxypeptidase
MLVARQGHTEGGAERPDGAGEHNAPPGAADFQDVKTVLLGTQERTLTRKVKEFFIALKVDRELPKEQILGDYVNTIYFGRRAYGIQAASQAWFGKDVSRLGVSEGAFLAGIINGPNLYDPLAGKASATRAQQRWAYVLDGMVTEGWLTPADRAKQVFPKVRPVVVPTGRKPEDQRQYLLDMVVAEAQDKADLSDDAVRTRGLRIVTTFDRKMIAEAVAAVADVLGPRKEWKRGTQAALATVDPATGAVKAIYGGDGSRSQNAAALDQVPAGSTFKPFGLVAALEGKRPRVDDPKKDCAPVAADTGLNLRSRFDGSSPRRIAGYAGGKVYNFGSPPGEQFGMIDLMSATAHSVNTVFAQLNERQGAPRQTMDVAVCAGLPRDTAGLDALTANILGPSSPHPIDMASAYATFAAEGVRNDPYVIATIKENGGIFYQHRPAPRRVFDRGVIDDATYAMAQVVRRGTGTYASNLGRPAAGKTGTSSDNHSAWFVGFTPQLSTAVAMYRLTPQGGEQALQGWGIYAGSELTGGSYPVRVWTAFMDTALHGLPTMQLPDPVFGGEARNPAPVVTSARSGPTSTSTTSSPVPTTTGPTGTPTVSPTSTATGTATGSPTSPSGSPTRTRKTLPPRPTPPVPVP